MSTEYQTRQKVKKRQIEKKGSMSQHKGTSPAVPEGGGEKQTTMEQIVELIRVELKKVKHREESRDELRKYGAEFREEVRKIQESNEKAITAFREELKETEVRLQAQESQVQQLDKVVSVHGDRVEKMEAEVEYLGGLCTTLKARLDEQEDFSRRQNLRVVGLPEGAEGANATSFVSKMLEALVVDNVLDKAPEVDRAHRSRRQKPGAGDPPRAIIVRLHKYAEKEKILRWAKEKRSHDWEGNTVRIYQDIGTELAKRRAGFNKAKAVLYRHNIRFGMLYPAKLWVTHKSREYYFETPDSVDNFIKEQKLREN